MVRVPSIDIASNGDIAFVMGGNGDISVDGTTEMPALGIIDLVTGRLASDGTLKWYRRFGAPGVLVDDKSPWTTFALQPDGKAIILFGIDGQPVDFGFGPLAHNPKDIGLVQVAD